MKGAEPEAKIFLAQDRGLCESAFRRSYSTFNHSNFFNEHKKAFDSLFLLNDEMLAAGSFVEIEVERSSYQLFIPLRGELTLQFANESITVDVEELAIVSCSKGEKLQIRNEYDAEWISFIHLAIDLNSVSCLQGFFKHKFSFADKGLQNALSVYENSYPFKINIGLFDGRQEELYSLKKTNNNAFCFILNGAFEVNGCLLHDRDGLALRNVKEVEMEALSNHAVIILIELPD